MLDLASVFQPFPILETERLILRQICPDDIPDLISLLSDHEVLRYHDLAPIASVNEAADLVERLTQRYHNYEGIRWAITLKAGAT